MRVLDSAQRELIELAYYRGHSHSELAALTGLPLGTVKSRLRAALDRMRGALSSPAETPLDQTETRKGGEHP